MLVPEQSSWLAEKPGWWKIWVLRDEGVTAGVGVKCPTIHPGVHDSPSREPAGFNGAASSFR